jgi:hypothetical protein
VRNAPEWKISFCEIFLSDIAQNQQGANHDRPGAKGLQLGQRCANRRSCIDYIAHNGDMLAVDRLAKMRRQLINCQSQDRAINFRD